MAQQLTDAFLIFTLCVLAIACIFYLVRAVVGPGFSARILAVNSIQTIVIIIICIIAVLQGESYLVDVALIYACMSFVTVIIICKAYLRSHHKDRANDLSNLKGGKDK